MGLKGDLIPKAGWSCPACTKDLDGRLFLHSNKPGFLICNMCERQINTARYGKCWQWASRRGGICPACCDGFIQPNCRCNTCGVHFSIPNNMLHFQEKFNEAKKKDMEKGKEGSVVVFREQGGRIKAFLDRAGTLCSACGETRYTISAEEDDCVYCQKCEKLTIRYVYQPEEARVAPIRRIRPDRGGETCPRFVQADKFVSRKCSGRLIISGMATVRCYACNHEFDRWDIEDTHGKSFSLDSSCDELGDDSDQEAAYLACFMGQGGSKSIEASDILWAQDIPGMPLITPFVDVEKVLEMRGIL